MIRLLVVLPALLSVLIGADHLLRRNQESRRIHESTLRLLSRIRVEQVAELGIASGSNSWNYVLRDGIWYCPDYFDAYAQGDRIERLLEGLLQSLATVVRADPVDLRRFGLTPERAMRVHLTSSNGMPLLEVWVGRGAPGSASGEAYVKLASADTVFHLHANPRLALDEGRPPMVDPYVLPRALARRSISRVIFERESAYPLRYLRRLQIPAPVSSRSGLPPQRPTYEWRAGFAAGEQACVRSSVFAYLGFLARLRYEELRYRMDPVHHSGALDRLILEDSSGRVDTLEVGGRDAGGNTLMRHRSSGQVLAIAPHKAGLLFPASRALLDTLPLPTPYQLAEPPVH